MFFKFLPNARSIIILITRHGIGLHLQFTVVMAVFSVRVLLFMAKVDVRLIHDATIMLSGSITESHWRLPI